MEHDTVGRCIFISVVRLSAGTSFFTGLQKTGFSLGFVGFVAALRAIQDEARSNVPALGYTVPYAIGNILLTAWGSVIVAMMS